MARPKNIFNRKPLVTNVSLEFKEHLKKIADHYSIHFGKLITLSELVRMTLEEAFPMKLDQVKDDLQMDFTDENQLIK